MDRVGRVGTASPEASAEAQRRHPSRPPPRSKPACPRAPGNLPQGLLFPTLASLCPGRGEEDPVPWLGALSYWPESTALTVLYPRKPPVLGKTRRLAPPPCEEGSTEVWWC